MAMAFLVILLFLVLIFTGYFIGIYNRLIFLKNNSLRTWANIDVLLKQRHDEIPKLVSVCESYMQYEKKVLENVVSLRAQAINSTNMQQRLDVEQKLTTALTGLFAVVENYPQLKANENFTNLQKRISYLEEQLADRRELYNDSATIFNIRIEQVPYNIVASMFNFVKQELFKVAAEDKEDVKINIKVP